MKTTFPLYRQNFGREAQTLIINDDFTVQTFCYSSGIEAIKISNAKGFLTVLPFYGQMIWDAEFEGHNLKMENMFSQPKRGSIITETYGCFAFHSGLISNGCPSPEDSHPLHGEMPCATMDKAWLELDGDKLRICGSYEYVMGFGHHYQASPSVTMSANSALFDIGMSVTNLSSSQMPLQYMCHMNYAYMAHAKLEQNIPESAIVLRQSVPDHVKPTASWLDFNNALRSGEIRLDYLEHAQMCDPEIVFFMDKLSQYSGEPVFTMTAQDGTTFMTRFKSDEFNYATRWILYNGDQKVGAFVLPATCRPEGYLAAERSGSLILLAPGESRNFNVTTGVSSTRSLN